MFICSPSNSLIFARVDDDCFFSDGERIKTLIELYEYDECLWNVRLPMYKNLTSKKLAKTKIGKHFGWSGNNNFCSIFVEFYSVAT